MWLVVGDSELRALLLAIGEEAGIPVAAIEPETVGDAAQSRRTPRSDAREPQPRPVAVRSRATRGQIERLAIASGDIQPEGEGNGFHRAIFLKLPASLEDVERTLHWLAGNGGQLDPAHRAE